jgi:hypothetical protein
MKSTRHVTAKRAGAGAHATAWKWEMDAPRGVGRDFLADIGLVRLISWGERVYRLYLPAPACASHADRPRLRQAGGLTPEEIRIVEESAK